MVALRADCRVPGRADEGQGRARRMLRAAGHSPVCTLLPPWPPGPPGRAGLPGSPPPPAPASAGSRASRQVCRTRPGGLHSPRPGTPGSRGRPGLTPDSRPPSLQLETPFTRSLSLTHTLPHTNKKPKSASRLLPAMTFPPRVPPLWGPEILGLAEALQRQGSDWRIHG